MDVAGGREDDERPRDDAEEPGDPKEGPVPAGHERPNRGLALPAHDQVLHAGRHDEDQHDGGRDDQGDDCVHVGQDVHGVDELL